MDICNINWTLLTCENAHCRVLWFIFFTTCTSKLIRRIWWTHCSQSLQCKNQKCKNKKLFGCINIKLKLKKNEIKIFGNYRSLHFCNGASIILHTYKGNLQFFSTNTNVQNCDLFKNCGWKEPIYSFFSSFIILQNTVWRCQMQQEQQEFKHRLFIESLTGVLLSFENFKLQGDNQTRILLTRQWSSIFSILFICFWTVTLIH